MSILRAFNIGISGMDATGKSIGVIGDNIANANTTGFKASRPEFQDILATSLRGTDGEGQLGAGVQLSNIKTVMSQGDITRTENFTDLAINGDGFFQVKAPFGSGYTRDGSLHFNNKGELASADGHPVMGFMPNADGEITSAMDIIKVGSTIAPAKATTRIESLMNLDTRGEVLEFDINDVKNTANYSHSVTVYDNAGNQRLVTMAYNKVDANTWQYRALIDGKDAVVGLEGPPPEGTLVEVAGGRLVFDGQGKLQEEVEELNNFAFRDTGEQSMAFDFGRSLGEGGNGIGATTGYGTDTRIFKTLQDGHESAELGSLSFDEKGVLTAVYTNGISKKLGQVAVAKFESSEGLFKIGKNLFKESQKSGPPTLGLAGEEGRGEILSQSLELSNVDIAKEFVGLMTSQRSFAANAKALSTADQMLQEVLSIKS